MSDKLADQILPLVPGGGYKVSIGDVTSVKPLEVNILGEDSLPVGGVNADYVPAVDDVVLILQNETDVIVVCQIVSGG